MAELNGNDEFEGGVVVIDNTTQEDEFSGGKVVVDNTVKKKVSQPPLDGSPQPLQEAQDVSKPSASVRPSTSATEPFEQYKATIKSAIKGEKPKEVSAMGFPVVEKEKGFTETFSGVPDTIIPTAQDFGAVIDKGKEEKGSRLGYWYNGLLEGIGSKSAGAADLIFQLGAKVFPRPEGVSEEDAVKTLRDELTPAIRKGTKQLLGAEVSPEKEEQFDNEFLTSAVKGLTTSSVAMADPYGTGLFLQAYDSGLQSINNTEKGKDLPETTKTIFAGTVGAAQGALEKYGLSKIFGKGTTKVANDLAAKTLSEMIEKGEKNITNEMFEAALDAQVKTLKSRVLKVGAATAIESETGALQELSTIFAEKGVNAATGDDIFEPKSWGEYTGRVLYAAGQEAVGGGLLGGFSQISPSSPRNYISEKVSNAKSGEDIANLKKEIVGNFQSGKISEQQANEAVGLVDRYVAINSTIPAEVTNRKAVADLIAEKEEVQQAADAKLAEAEKVDEAFKPTIQKEAELLQQRVEEINSQILNPSQILVSGKEVDEDAFRAQMNNPDFIKTVAENGEVEIKNNPKLAEEFNAKTQSVKKEPFYELGAPEAKTVELSTEITPKAEEPIQDVAGVSDAMQQDNTGNNAAPAQTTNKVFNKEEFIRDIDTLERQKANGSKNIGLYSFKDKFVKRVKSRRKLSNKDLDRLRDRVKGLDNVFTALEIIDLPDGSQAIVMDKASGKIGNELTQSEIDNIPQEHWNKFEKTIRELSNRGISTDLTKKSNVLYDKDKGFQFIDLEGASVEGDATNKFFIKDGKEYYYSFERYPFFPKPYKSAKEIFTEIGASTETNARGELKTIINEKTKKEDSPQIEGNLDNADKGKAKSAVRATEKPVPVKDDTKDFSEGRKFALDYVLNDLVDVKPLRPKMTAAESAKMKARKKVVVDGKEVKSIRKAAKDISQRVDWQMKNEERHRAIRDIKKGKYNTVSAKMLLDRLEQFHDNGYFDFIAGTGNMTVSAGEIPIADIKSHLAEVKALKEEIYAEYTPEMVAYFAENDAMVNDFLEAIESGEVNDNNLKQQTKTIQDENESRKESTTQEDVRAGVEEPSGEAGRTGKKIADKIRAFADKIEVKFYDEDGNEIKLTKSGTGLSEKEILYKIADLVEKGGELIDHIRAVLNEQDWYKNLTDKGKEAVEKQIAEKMEEGEKEISEKREKRRLAQQFLSSKDISQKFKDAITEEAIYYDRFPNNLSLQDANAYLETFGEEAAMKAVLDLSNGMRFAPRMILGQVLIKKMNAKGYDAEAVEFSEKFFELSTELGQGIQALSLFQFLTPEGQVKAAQKVVKKMRDKQIKGSYKQIKKLKASVDKANKEAAEEVVKKVAKKIKKVSEIPNINSPKYGEKNKIVTKDEYNKLLKELRGSMFSNVDPRIVKIAAFHIEAGSREFAQFTETMVKTLGKKVKPYLKDLYKQAQDLFENKEGFTTDEDILKAENEAKGQEVKEKISKALKSGNKKTIEEAIAEISQNGDLWGKYKDMAVKRLQQMSMSEIQSDIKQKAVLDEFTQGLIKNIKEQAEKKGEGKSVEKKPAIQIIADAYKNFEKYQEVWEQTKKDFAEKNKDNPEKLAELDAYFGDITLKPFSENLVKQSIKEGLKDLDIKIGEIIKAHYTVYEDYKRSLVNKLIDDAGLSQQEANELAKEIEKEFDKLALEKRKQYLDKALNQKQRSKPNVKQLYEKLLEISNVGVLSDNQFNELYAQKMGYATLTPEQANKIKELAEKVQSAPDGHLKFRAIEDLLKYHANLKGVNYWEIPLAWWYASVLSGHQTQQRNIIANVANTVMLYANAAMQSRSPIFLAKAAVLGMKKGWLEAQDVLQTGYSPIRGKIEVPPVLERIKFEGWKYPANAAKYVRRAMVAADVLFFEAQKEMRAYQLALVQARKEGKLDPSLNERNRTLQILNASNGAFEVAIEQAQLEMETKLQEIENSTLSAKEKAKEKKAAEHAMQRRAYDILNELRPTSIKDESATFASKGTYNYTPQGLLGAMAKSLNSFSDKAWFVRLVVPFVNIISNVANDALNYTPYGFARYATLKKVGENEYEGGSLSGKLASKEFNENITEQERADMLYKAAMGVVFTAAFLMLSAADDDDEPEIEVTANGTGDWRKNLELRETGWQPYSVRFRKPSGGYTDWVSYQYSPLILALGWVGNIRDFEKYREEKIDDSFISKYGAATSYTMRSIFDMSFLNSADKMLSGIFDIRNENKAEDAYQALQKSAKTFIVPNAYTQSAKMMQDYFDMGQKETRGTWLGYTLRDIPIARGMYKDQINVLGEPVQPDSDVLFSGSEASKELQLLVDKNVFISQPNPLKDTYLDEKDGWKEKEFQTNPEKFYQYAKERGTLIKDFVSENYDYLRTLPKKDVKRIMTHVQSSATEYAKYSDEVRNLKGKPDFKDYVEKLKKQPKQAELSEQEQELKDMSSTQAIELLFNKHKSVNLNKYPNAASTEMTKLINSGIISDEERKEIIALIKKHQNNQK